MAGEELSDRGVQALEIALDTVARSRLLAEDARRLRTRARALRSRRKPDVRSRSAQAPVVGLVTPLSWPNEHFLARWPAVTAQPN